MKAIFLFYDLWEYIQDGYDDSEDTVASTNAHKKKDAKALSLIQQGVADTIFPMIINATKSKEAWDILHKEYRGTLKPPFTGGNRQKIQQKIIKDKMKLPAFLSSEAHSLLKGLPQKEANKRLGSGQGGSEEIKSHKLFRSINWRKLDSREIQPSFLP